MPGTTIVQPPDIPQVIADLQRRLAALEQSSPSALTHLNGVRNAHPVAGGTLPFTTVFADCPETQVSFTLTRPRLVLATSGISFFPSGGTASFTYVNFLVRLASAAANSGPIADLDGNLAQTTGQAVATNGAGVQTAYPTLTNRLAAGNYVALMQYRMDAGAATTWNDYNSMVDIWAVGG